MEFTRKNDVLREHVVNLKKNLYPILKLLLNIAIFYAML